MVYGFVIFGGVVLVFNLDIFIVQVVGVEVSYVMVEEYEVFCMEEEEMMFGLGVGGNVLVVIVDERESLGNVGV